MYKNILLITGLLSTALSGFTQNNFFVKGNFPEIKEPKKIIFGYSGKNTWIEDTAIIRNGEFHFEGKIENPVFAVLEILPMNSASGWSPERMLYRDYQDFFLDKGKTTVTGKDRIDSAKIKSGKTELDFLALRQMEEKVNAVRIPVLKKFQRAMVDKDSLTMQKLGVQLTDSDKEISKIEEDFVRSHPASWVSLSIVHTRSAMINPDTFEPLLMSLDTSLRNTADGKKLAMRLAQAKNTALGSAAPEFSMNDMDGNMFSLKSLRGKYVLLDFWASWCIPCRAENPNVVKAYQQFHDRNIDFVSVSLDENKTLWTKAVAKDNLTWKQLSDLKGWENEAAKKYEVGQIPLNFLISPDGKIIAKNLRGEELIKKLSEIFH